MSKHVAQFMQVNAYKRKGKSGMRQMVGVPGSQEMVKVGNLHSVAQPRNTALI